MIITDLDTITEAGAFAPVLPADHLANRIAIVQAVATGDPTAATVIVEGSLDGANWSILETHAFTADELTDLSALFYVSNKPAAYIRVSASVLTFTTSGTLTVKVSDEV